MFVTLLQPINSLPIFTSCHFLLVIKSLSDPPIQYSFLISFYPILFSTAPTSSHLNPFSFGHQIFIRSSTSLVFQELSQDVSRIQQHIGCLSIFYQNPMKSTLVWFCDLISLLSTDTWCCFSNWRCWSCDKFHTFTMRQLSHNGTQPSSPSQSPKSSPSSSPKSHPQDHLHSKK